MKKTFFAVTVQIDCSLSYKILFSEQTLLLKSMKVVFLSGFMWAPLSKTLIRN